MTQKDVSSSAWPARRAIDDSALEVLRDLSRTVTLRERDGRWGLSDDTLGGQRHAIAPPCRPEDLGDTTFCRDTGIRYPYLSGSMANGIGSAEIVEAMGGTGLLGFFGAAGLSLAEIEKTIDRLETSLAGRPCGFNLIHTPNEPQIEKAVVDLYIRRRVRLVEASAFLGLTRPLLRYRLDGIHRDAQGRVVTPNRVIAKASRIEVASKFFAPPSADLVADLVRAGELTSEQADLAREVPVAQDLTAEADSGGHTDNRPLVTLLPTFLELCQQRNAEFGFAQRLRVGVAGGISTPLSAAAAFAMGAGWILTGTINQACIESGSSDAVRRLLASTEQADVIMAPAPDMFEMGVKVQVLKRGTMFAMRATKLHDLYRRYASIDDLPSKERASLEKTVFRAPLEKIWQDTREFFLERDPSQVERAERDPKHKLSLVFRWYLGLASRWANSGEPTRAIDYQIWCGPAMGAFNEWVKDSPLADPAERRVVAVALNILEGASLALRASALRFQGVPLEHDQLLRKPVSLAQLEETSTAARVNV